MKSDWLSCDKKDMENDEIIQKFLYPEKHEMDESYEVRNDDTGISHAEVETICKKSRWNSNTFIT